MCVCYVQMTSCESKQQPRKSKSMRRRWEAAFCQEAQITSATLKARHMPRKPALISTPPCKRRKLSRDSLVIDPLLPAFKIQSQHEFSTFMTCRQKSNGDRVLVITPAQCADGNIIVRISRSSWWDLDVCLSRQMRCFSITDGIAHYFLTLPADTRSLGVFVLGQNAICTSSRWLVSDLMNEQIEIKHFRVPMFQDADDKRVPDLKHVVQVLRAVFSSHSTRSLRAICRDSLLERYQRLCSTFSDWHRNGDAMRMIDEQSRYLRTAAAPQWTDREESRKDGEDEAEEPQAEEPQAEEPRAEEPQAEEPQAEEPQAEEPQAEEPQADEPRKIHVEHQKIDEPSVAFDSMPLLLEKLIALAELLK